MNEGKRKDNCQDNDDTEEEEGRAETRENGGKIDLFFARLAFELCLCIQRERERAKCQTYYLTVRLIFFLC